MQRFHPGILKVILPNIYMGIHQGITPRIPPGSLYAFHKKNCKRIHPNFLQESPPGISLKIPLTIF